MILSLFATREEFAARRRKAQDEAVEILTHDVPEAVEAQEVTDDLLASMELVYSAAYYDENKDGVPKMPASVVPKVNTLIGHTTPDSDLHAAALAITNLLINEATMQAAVDDEDDLFVEWVTMHDEAVRPPHADTDGQVRPVGVKFDVGGVEMAFPGDIAAPIELWINCRCVLRPTFPPEFHGRESSFDAEGFISEKPWNGAASRFTPEQWKSSCVLHVCDGMEKSCHKLPIKEPGGALSRAGVHAAAARVNQVDAPPEKVSAAKRALRGAYRTLGEEPPDVLKSSEETIVLTTATTSNTTIYSPSYTTTTAQRIEEEEISDHTPTTDLGEDQLDALGGLVPWHGVLAPEGVASGDGRTFGADSLTWRDLPLPLTYQKASASGHDGSVTVGSIENIERRDGLMLADGFLLATEEADEVVSLIAHFGKYGVSVDADDAEFDYDEDADSVVFSRARICSASVVSIPAFAEAYVTLGPWSEDEALAADAFVKTEDGPGWLTHPIDTDRLRDYWVRGPGAAKINWGTPGDFNRCRLHLAKYVKPQHLAGYCANRHYDALGFWPGRPVSGDAEAFTPATEDAEVAPAFTLTAAGAIKAPASWFDDPGLSGPTHLTVTEDGRVYGHIAQWGVCHIGIQKVCTTAPHSAHDYAFYASGSVLLDNGETVPTGVISMGGGHADGSLSAASAISHYDSVSTAVADVTVGEDDHGIWCAGWMRPGTTEEDRYTLRASDVSGDWRTIGTDLELVAVLAVNVNGFPVKVATRGGEMVTLVAAGMVEKDREPSEVEKMAEAVAKALEKVESNRKKRAAVMAGLRTKYTEDTDGV